MKKILTPKRSLSFIAAILMVAGFATAGYSDSFVDDNTINALKDFKFGQSNTFEPQTLNAVGQNENKMAFKGDSFVDASAIEAMKDFRFGVYTPAEKTGEPSLAKANRVNGDSFVDTATLAQLEGFVFLKGIVPAEDKNIAGQGFIYGKN